jgi:hypothetical protein
VFISIETRYLRDDGIRTLVNALISISNYLEIRTLNTEIEIDEKGLGSEVDFAADDFSK